MTRVLIVEDAPMDRQLLELYISQCGKYELVPSVESAALAEFCCRTTRVDLILMDVCTSLSANGIEAARKIKQSFPHIKIIIITSQPECSFIDRARRAGVESFWYKTAAADSILDVMERTMAGESIYPDSTPPLQFGYITSDQLTDRERTELETLEHRRWNAYMRSEGYIYSGSPDRSSRNDLAKMHHNLVAYERLEDADKRKDSRVAASPGSGK